MQACKIEQVCGGSVYCKQTNKKGIEKKDGALKRVAAEDLSSDSFQGRGECSVKQFYTLKYHSLSNKSLAMTTQKCGRAVWQLMHGFLFSVRLSTLLRALVT